MIKIKSYGSGSSGNFYLITTTKHTNIVLECGIDDNIIRNVLIENNLQYTDINACITSHHHQDHSLSIKTFANYNIPCYCTYDTALRYNLSDDIYTQLVDNKKIIINKDVIFLSLTANHGATECYNFIIKDKDNLIFFGTDFMSTKKNFKAFKFDKIYIECNYIEEIWNKTKEDIANEEENANLQLKIKLDRQINSHMSLSNLIYILKNKFDLDNVDEIVCIHLSKDLADKEIIKHSIEEEFGIDTYCLLPNGIKY